MNSSPKDAWALRPTMRWVPSIGLMFLCFGSVGRTTATAGSDGGTLDVNAEAAWLFPLNPPDAQIAKVNDDTTPLRLANSRLAFTKARLNDLFFAPDWHPESHSPMPEIVLRGRAPATFACGFCHLPSGQGRPENAPLAGLPAAYIVQQVADMKSGARRSAWRGPYRPADLMREVAANVADADLAAAAEFFSAQSLQPRVSVIERSRIPRMRVMGWVYVIDASGGSEALGQRLLEWAPDGERHERRDDAMRYTAFVPPGSLARGRTLALHGQADVTLPCIACHGRHLQGVGLIPSLAGRSPTYLLRQLVAFKTKDRAGASGVPMQAVVANLGLSDMIAVTAYAAAR